MRIPPQAENTASNSVLVLVIHIVVFFNLQRCYRDKKSLRLLGTFWALVLSVTNELLSILKVGKFFIERSNFLSFPSVTNYPAIRFVSKSNICKCARHFFCESVSWLNSESFFHLWNKNISGAHARALYVKAGQQAYLALHICHTHTYREEYDLQFSLAASIWPREQPQQPREAAERKSFSNVLQSRKHVWSRASHSLALQAATIEYKHSIETTHKRTHIAHQPH